MKNNKKKKNEDLSKGIKEYKEFLYSLAAALMAAISGGLAGAGFLSVFGGLLMAFFMAAVIGAMVYMLQMRLYWGADK